MALSIRSVEEMVKRGFFIPGKTNLQDVIHSDYSWLITKIEKSKEHSNLILFRLNAKVSTIAIYSNVQGLLFEGEQNLKSYRWYTTFSPLGEESFRFTILSDAEVV